jgi:5-methylcytosine-specific restriction endonuclease McrA
MSKSLTLPKLTDKAQKVFNAWIRHRDSKDGYFTCISCFRTLPVEQMNAGHYVPVKGGSALRFNENNVNGECIRCNGFDEFHLINYRKNLIRKIGYYYVKKLEKNRNLVYKWSHEELGDIIKKYSIIKNTKNGTNNHLPF